MNKQTGVAGRDLELLKERARLLARAPAPPETAETALVAEFSLGDHTYAVEASFVNEIRHLDNLTPVPCTPDFVAGVVNVRGTLYSLLDLRKFLGTPVAGVTDLTEILLIRAAGLDVGVLAHEVLGLAEIKVDDVKAPLPTDPNTSRPFVRGITPSLTVFLDVEKLFADPQMVVHEEVLS